jgi:hypothetical protein
VESLKPRRDFLEPDPRNLAFAKMRADGVMEPVTLDDQYAMIGYAPALHQGVPDDVGSYMEAVKNLFLYAWLSYPFYAFVHSLSYAVVEMALRRRLPYRGPGRDKRGLQNLLEQAAKQGLLKDEAFPSLQRRRQVGADLDAALREAGECAVPQAPKEPFVQILLKHFAAIRNTLTHPHGHWIIPPGIAVDSLVLAAEIINQLWEEPAAVIAGSS